MRSQTGTVARNRQENRAVQPIPRAIERVRKQIPDLDARIGQFESDPFEPDDELIAAFREELERLTGDLQRALAERDTGGLQQAAHSLKGMFCSIGLPELAVMAQEIELALHDGRGDRCRVLADDLMDWARAFAQGCGG